MLRTSSTTGIKITPTKLVERAEDVRAARNLYEENQPNPQESYFFRSTAITIIPSLIRRLQSKYPFVQKVPILIEGDSRARDALTLRISQVAADAQCNQEPDAQILARLTATSPIVRRDLNSGGLEPPNDTDKMLILRLHGSNPILAQKAINVLGQPRLEPHWISSLGQFFLHDLRQPTSNPRRVPMIQVIQNVWHYLTSSQRNQLAANISSLHEEGSFVVLGQRELDPFLEGKYTGGRPLDVNLSLRRAGYVPDIEANKSIKEKMLAEDRYSGDNILPIDERKPHALPNFVWRKDTELANAELEKLKTQAVQKLLRGQELKRLQRNS